MDVDVLTLQPADLTARVPLWETGVTPGHVGIAVVDGTAAEWRAAAETSEALTAELAAAPVLTLAVVRGEGLSTWTRELVNACDLVVGPGLRDDAAIDGEVAALVDRLEQVAGPALVAAQLLRIADRRIATESFAYSALLGGEAFRDWRRATNARPTAVEAAPQRVEVEQTDGVAVVRLARRDRHNAFDGQMREQLCDAFDAVTAAGAAAIVLVGDGPSFCSGGDLDEFGLSTDLVSAHVVRHGRSVARRLERVADRLVVGVHGHCIGAGLEFAAFARVVVAARGTSFRLPEVSLGLNLGAGGTVSIPRRIGRHRTLELLVLGTPIDATTALEWELVDEIVEPDDVERRCRAIASSWRGGVD